MSRSFVKYKRVGMCIGDNTPYYDIKRRQFRGRIRNNIRRTWSQTRDPELFDEMYLDYKGVFKDDWDEPTDGTWLVDSRKCKNYGFYKVKGKNRIRK